MKLFNTLTRQVEALQPIHDKTVSLYTCGPTVYNFYHIGNLRNAVFNDTLRRTLEATGYKVRHVMNITDVGHLASDADEGDDKLEAGATREGKTVQEVAEFYTHAFKADMEAMGVLPPNTYHSQKYDDTYARATEFIQEQIDMVQVLLEKGFAYQTKQAIYFDVTKLPDYGVLTGQKMSDKEVAVRAEVVTDSEKRSPHDFAVWFFTIGRFADHSMHWGSPWGDGFPGWHLECSAIIHATLGDPIDIHTGGVDHIGTHHPNEMAQTEAAFGHPLAHMWIHNEFILVDGQKMSKSKGNSYTLADLKNKGFSALDYRMLVLQSHYRSELHFSWDNLAAAHNRLQDIYAWADLRHQATDEEVPQELRQLATSTQTDILAALADDLNTPKALGALGKLIDYMQNKTVPGNNEGFMQEILRFLDSVFALELAVRPDINKEQKEQIAKRQSAREKNDWDTADAIRQQLLEQGITVRDTAAGQQWSRL